MAKIVQNMTALIGGTPLAEVCRLTAGLQARVLVKLEYLNPTGSVKDRAALAMVEDAEQRGLLSPGATLIEPTSGNTGIGLAAIAAVRGYRVILTMPDSMSMERRNMLKAYGAEIVLTEGKLGMAGAVAKAEELSRAIPNSWIPAQFDNSANALAHEKTTGPEIWDDTDGQVDVLVAGVGTGGTLTGTARYLRQRNPALYVAAVEPADSPLLSQGKSGPHPLQGIGANFVPTVLDRSLIDEVMPVTGEEAYAAAKALARQEGYLTGISSGAALHGALMLAQRTEMAGKTIVVILPDSGDRYYSTPLFQGE